MCTTYRQKSSTSGISGLEAALPWREAVGALTVPKPHKAPSMNTLKLFLLFRRLLFTSGRNVLSFLRCMCSHQCVCMLSPECVCVLTDLSCLTGELSGSAFLFKCSSSYFLIFTGTGRTYRTTLLLAGP